MSLLARAPFVTLSQFFRDCTKHTLRNVRFRLWRQELSELSWIARWAAGL